MVVNATYTRPNPYSNSLVPRLTLAYGNETNTVTAHVSPHVHSTCTGYVLYAYLYCVYALVGGAISIRDPYICAVHESVPTNPTLSSTGPLFCSENVAVGFKTIILWGKAALGSTPELLEVSKLRHNF